MKENIVSKEISESKRAKIKKGFLSVGSFFPLFLSHHPQCEQFKGHTLKLGNLRLCIGCFVGYSSAIITLFLINIFKLEEHIPLSYFLFFSIIFLATFILSPLTLTKIKAIKIIQKILIGMGGTFLFIWIINLPNSPKENFLIFFITFSILLSVLNSYHVYGFLHTCYQCETPFDWGNCAGFENIRFRFKKFELHNFLRNMDNFSNTLIQKREMKKKKD